MIQKIGLAAILIFFLSLGLSRATALDTNNQGSVECIGMRGSGGGTQIYYVSVVHTQDNWSVEVKHTLVGWVSYLPGWNPREGLWISTNGNMESVGKLTLKTTPTKFNIRPISSKFGKSNGELMFTQSGLGYAAVWMGDTIYYGTWPLLLTCRSLSLERMASN